MNQTQSRVLLVDDDPSLLRLLSIRLSTAGYEVSTATSGQAAIDTATSSQPNVVVTDLRMDGMNGMQVLDEFSRRWPGLPVLMITAHGTIPDAVAATQQGAFGFLTKPVDKDELLTQVDRAVKLGGARRDEHQWRSHIVTRSAKMEGLLSQVRRVAQGEASVLLVGQSGTGKELVAQAIHKASRRTGDFVAVNCGAIPNDLLESELFGHARGAFTGAVVERTGLIESAHDGTLFLDEIGDMPMALQVKLLRAIQEKQVRPVGGNRVVPVSARFISATHHDLESAMKANLFREDLYYRLAVVELHIPELHDRRGDIPQLVAHKLQLLAENGETRKRFSPAAMELLTSARWPGNVRQLFNLVEKMVALSTSQIIGPRLVKHALGDRGVDVQPLSEARDEFTRNYLIQLLQLSQGNVSRAARLAQRNRTDFYKLLARHGVDLQSFKTDIGQLHA